MANNYGPVPYFSLPGPPSLFCLQVFLGAQVVGVCILQLASFDLYSRQGIDLGSIARFGKPDIYHGIFIEACKHYGNIFQH
jgi:hypothetical protein